MNTNFPSKYCLSLQKVIFHLSYYKCETMSNTFSGEDVRDLLSKISKLEEVIIIFV